MKLQTKTAVTTLKKLHKNLALELKASEKNSERVRAALAHVEAVIGMLAPDSSIAELANARRRNKVLTFKRGEPVRLTFEVLRQANEPLTVRQITDRIRGYRCQGAARRARDVPLAPCGAERLAPASRQEPHRHRKCLAGAMDDHSSLGGSAFT